VILEAVTMAGLPNPVPSSAASSSNRRFSTRNVLMREVFSSLSTTSLAIKLITLTLVLFYALSFNSDLVTAISVTPGYFWPPHFWIWTAFTHCFLEVHFWEVLIDVAIIVLVGKLLEPLWGAIEMVVFFAVVNVGVALLSSVFYYILYMITFNTELLFDVHIHGKSRTRSTVIDAY
jgi:membrane associated rhomboid family serine protease